MNRTLIATCIIGIINDCPVLLYSNCKKVHFWPHATMSWLSFFSLIPSCKYFGYHLVYYRYVIIIAFKAILWLHNIYGAYSLSVSVHSDPCSPTPGHPTPLSLRGGGGYGCQEWIQCHATFNHNYNIYCCYIAPGNIVWLALMITNLTVWYYSTTRCVSDLLILRNCWLNSDIVSTHFTIVTPNGMTSNYTTYRWLKPRVDHMLVHI